MIPAMRLTISLAALVVLSACREPQIICNAEGLIIIPEDAPTRLRSDWAGRNLELSLKRLGKIVGSEETRWTSQASLEKAKGCP
jgi:hypothetical protein